MAKLSDILKSSDIKSLVLGVLAQNYVKGQLSYDEDSLTILADTGINSVRVNIGQEEMYLVWNDHATNTIANGKVCFASGVDATNTVLKASYADSTSFATSAQVLGLATHDIAPKSLGLVTHRGVVRGFNTTGITSGLIYLGTNGDMTNTKPLFPNNRIAMGVKLKDGTTDGEFMVSINNLPRRSASRSYNFTSQGIAAGTYWKAGFYDFDSIDANLSQGNTSVNWGVAGRGYFAHAAVVPSAAGAVDTGQVGLRVVGIKDGEDGTPQAAGQIGIITEDITTLTGDTYFETSEKFSGEITFELYVVSGSPTTYSLDFNYGYSKYEDAADIDFTVMAFEAVWQGNANGNSLDIELLHHKTDGWTYAATGFEAGNGNICKKSTDMALAGDTTDGKSGSYKRVGLNQFIDGNGSEGVLIKVTTSGNNTIQTMDMHLVAISEELG